MVVRRDQIRRIGWMLKTLEAQVGQFLLGCNYPVSRGIVVQEQDPPSWASRGILASKCPSFAPAEMSNTPRWEFGPLEGNQWRGCRLDSKKSRRELFQRIFALGIFWGWVSRYTVTPLIIALSPGHNDITRFRPLSPVTPNRKSFGSRQRISKCFSEDWYRWRFWSAFRHFGTHSAESFCMPKSSWMKDPTRSREMPVAQLFI